MGTSVMSQSMHGTLEVSVNLALTRARIDRSRCSVHPNLHFISHIPHTIKGEQLVAQLFRAIPEHVWLFKFGRVPMSFILGEWVWQVRPVFCLE